MNLPTTALLVDDEPHVRKFVGLTLQQLGPIRLLEAGNGAEALALYQQHRPDLVLLDVNMPVMDGIATLRELRAADPEAVVVMLTSLANRQTIEECGALGATNYIRKDTPRAELLATLTETIDAVFGDEE